MNLITNPIIQVRESTLNQLLEDKRPVDDAFFKNVDPAFLEAVLVSNRHLYDSIINYFELPQKKQKHLKKTVNNFITRLKSRATPFGIFSSVSWNAINADFDSIDGEPHLEKRARPDFNWIIGVSSLVEHNSSFTLKADLLWNPTVYMQGNRFILPNDTIWSHAEKISNNSRRSIVSNTIISFIYTNLQETTSFNDLLMTVSQKFPQYDSSAITDFLLQLIDSEFIITTFRPSLSGEDALSELISKVGQVDRSSSIYNKLVQIRSLLDQYNQATIGTGIGLYQKISELMRSLFITDRLLRVDLFNRSKPHIKNEPKLLSSTIDFLTRVTPKQEQIPYIKSYLDKFIKKYEFNRLVPIQELLDPNQGLGSPFHDTTTISKSSKSEKCVTDFIDYRIMESIKNGSNSISLTTEDLENIIDHPDFQPANLPKSFEVFAQLLSNTEPDDPKMRLIQESGSDAVGKASGRFNYYSHLNIHDNFHDTSPLLVELNELVKNASYMNVLENQSDLSLELNLGVTASQKRQPILIHDIYVGVERKTHGYTFSFFSKELHKRLIFTNSSMINYRSSAIFSDIGRFLLEASTADFDNPFFIQNYLSGISKFPRIPRIVHEKTVISPEKWNLMIKNYGIFAHSSIESIKQKLMAYFNEWSIPEQVQFTGNHKSMRINTSSSEDINNIARMLKSQNINLVSFTEIIDYKQQQQNTAPKEIVLGFSLRNTDSQDTAADIVLPDSIDIAQTDPVRLIPFGNKWIYIKIYGISIPMSEFIYTNLASLAEYLINHQFICQFHYLRYFDPNSHVRMRFKLRNQDQLSIVLKTITSWVNKQLSLQTITDVSYASYNRELERYGGINNIDTVESTFFKDSENTVQELQYMKNKMKNSSERILFLLNSLMIFQKEIIDKRVITLHDVLCDFDNELTYKKYKKDFRKIESDIGSLPIQPKSYNHRILDTVIPNQASTEQYLNLIRSLIHMHCNRLLINREEEEKLMFLMTRVAFSQ